MRKHITDTQSQPYRISRTFSVCVRFFRAFHALLILLLHEKNPFRDRDFVVKVEHATVFTYTQTYKKGGKSIRWLFRAESRSFHVARIPTKTNAKQPYTLKHGKR